MLGLLPPNRSVFMLCLFVLKGVGSLVIPLGDCLNRQRCWERISTHYIVFKGTLIGSLLTVGVYPRPPKWIGRKGGENLRVSDP
jgi:hypothetical protein